MYNAGKRPPKDFQQQFFHHARCFDLHLTIIITQQMRSMNVYYFYESRSRFVMHFLFFFTYHFIAARFNVIWNNVLFCCQISKTIFNILCNWVNSFQFCLRCKVVLRNRNYENRKLLIYCIFHYSYNLFYMLNYNTLFVYWSFKLLDYAQWLERNTKHRRKG